MKRHDWIWAFLFIGPTVAGLYLFNLYPIFGSFYFSLTKWDPMTSPEFIGLANYVRFFGDRTLGLELFNTLFFVVTLVPLILACSLLLGNALNQKSIFTSFFRTVFFMPYVILPVTTATTWLIMFNARYGFINIVLGMIGLPQPAWLANEWTVRVVIIIVGLWASIGYYGIIVLAGLQNIPAQLYEACELDGGGRIWQFFHITIPLVTPQIFFITVISAISLFQMFDYILIFGRNNIFILDSIRNLAYGIYERGFTFMEMGYASAKAVLFCMLILFITILQYIGQKKWVHYG